MPRLAAIGNREGSWWTLVWVQGRELCPNINRNVLDLALGNQAVVIRENSIPDDHVDFVPEFGVHNITPCEGG